jgi:hypothetical protein
MQPLRHDRGLEPPSPTWEHYLVTIFLCKVQFIKRSANIYIYIASILTLPSFDLTPYATRDPTRSLLRLYALRV